jgi:hypothetical protein
MASWDDMESWHEDAAYPFDYVKRYELIGDTIIESDKYSKVYLTRTAGYHKSGPCDFFYWEQPKEELTYSGGFRSDTNQRVFFVPPDSTVEKTIYDFSVQTKDTIVFERSGRNYSYMAVVLNVDSVLIQDSYRKRIQLDNNDFWIDGIGSVKGLFYTYNNFDSFHEFQLLCFKENDVPIYYYHYLCGDWWCNLVTDISPSQQNIHLVQIYPNPVIDVSRISIDEDFSQINIYDVSGFKIHTYFPDIESIEIRRKDFKPGIYIIEVISNSRNTYHQKVIMN